MIGTPDLGTGDPGPVWLVQGDLDAATRDRLLNRQLIAVDTETSGLSWKSDRLGLVQIAADGVGVVMVHIDGQPADYPNLRLVLASAQVSKVLHHAPFDLRFVSAHLDTVMRPVYCTKAAAKLLWPDPPPPGGYGLKALLAWRYGINLEKGAVRTSDWTSPDLTQEQVDYAARDVLYLPRLYADLASLLADRGLASDYHYLCSAMPTLARLEVAGIPDPLAHH